MKNILILASILFSSLAHGQNYLLANEQLILSFDTRNGKRAVLAKDKNNAYIVYRFGTATKIEFEYPTKSKDSWSKLNIPST